LGDLRGGLTLPALESTMRAWIERVQPHGDRIELPDGSGTLVFGRSARATLVFDDPLVSPRHCEVSFEAGFWRVRDLGTEGGTRVNQVAVTYPRSLFRGDVIEFGRTRLRFMSEEPEIGRAHV
jgi:two-component system, cell cycle response regulator